MDMESQLQSNKSEPGERVPLPGNTILLLAAPHPDEADLSENQNKLTRWAVVLLWTSILVLFLAGGILLYAEYQGAFKPSVDKTTPFPPGPPNSMN
jgi:hypothetical protein